ncbi:phosphate starvation-inducible protein [Xanthomonas phage vB_XciM_LucasX]|nr:phosphate starvation-inducible protein [Xanthomonas phage vB_XciM_LucasX]
MAKPKKSSRRSSREEIQELEATGRQPLRSSKTSKSAQRRADEAWNRSSNKPLTCKNEAQKNYLATIRSNMLTIGVGPAGTGKTYVCTKFAAIELDEGRADGIVVVRPIVEAGGGIGFLPGDVADKTAPYQVPFMEVLEEHYGKSHLENLVNGTYPKVVFIAPEFIRGRTFANKVVILDEAQNMTPLQMKTFLTRIGEGSKVIINGDIDQVDITGPSGLKDAMDKLQGLTDVGIAEFTEDDIVRSGLVKDILKRYRSHNAFA